MSASETYTAPSNPQCQLLECEQPSVDRSGEYFYKLPKEATYERKLVLLSEHGQRLSANDA